MTPHGWLKCLWCGVHANYWHHDRFESVSTCLCGAKYAQDLLAEADQDRWQRVIDRDGFEVSREGDELYVTDLDAANPE